MIKLPNYIKDPKVTGINLYFLAVEVLLGRRDDDKDWLDAKNKDITNHSRIDKRIEEWANSMKLKELRFAADFIAVRDIVVSILDEGYKDCVLQHTNAEQSMLNVIKEVNQHLLSLFPEESIKSANMSFKDYLGLVEAGGFGHLVTLNNTLTDKDQQPTWQILCAWIHPEWELTKASLAVLPPGATEKVVSNIEEVLSRFIKQGIVPNETSDQIYQQIKSGLLLHKKLSPQWGSKGSSKSIP